MDCHSVMMKYLDKVYQDVVTLSEYVEEKNGGGVGVRKGVSAMPKICS